MQASRNRARVDSFIICQITSDVLNTKSCNVAKTLSLKMAFVLNVLVLC